MRADFDVSEPGFVNDLDLTPVHCIIMGLEEADLDQQLRFDRTLFEKADAFGRSPLHWAVITGNVPATEILLRNGASPRSRDKERMTPLHDLFLCPTSCQLQTCALLLDAGAEVDALDAWKRTPLRIMAGYAGADIEAIRMMLQKRADVNCRDVYGQSPVLKSIQGSLETTRLLLQHGADIQERDIYGNTTALEAVYRDKPETLSLLLEKGFTAIEPFQLKPGRQYRDGPSYFLDFVLWHGNLEVMRVVDKAMSCDEVHSTLQLHYPNDDNFEDLKVFRQANGRRVEVDEKEAFHRILSKVRLRETHNLETEAEVFFDAAEEKSDIGGCICCI